ncbi:Uncharacterised protein [Mannheimia haemolytica]|uniref:Uncharacterized protein n=1 Tax=Mannheimia haemolytica TaxID=75985 RepID=A0A378MTZ2_MANHA|nr:Uncharacterised protein [Mannheimia haemolytica]
MNGFVNSRGEPLSIEPEFMLLPTSLHTKAKQILGSSSVEGADINSGIINPIRDIVSPIKSPRLQIADPKSWYLLNKEAIEVSYLDGWIALTSSNSTALRWTVFRPKSVLMPVSM